MRNTSKIDPKELLTMAMVMGTSESILHQEAQGQRDLCYSSELPTEMGYNTTRKLLEGIGIKFGEQGGDPLFIPVSLPEGWKINPTTHSMWSDLVDNKGRKRAAIFYKAAFYDRRALIDIERRFRVDVQPVGGYTAYYQRDRTQLETKEGIVTDCGVTVFTTPAFMEKVKYDETVDKSALSAAEAWLIENGYSDWKNPLAYWD